MTTPTPLQAAIELELRERERARANLIDFTTYTFPGYRAEPAHRLIAEHLDRVVSGQLKRLMMIAPPQHGKTELAGIRLPAFWLGRHPNDPVILASYAASLAERNSRAARGVVESLEFQTLFPGVVTNQESRAVERWELAGNRGFLLAAGVGGPVTGHGGLLGILDDVVENWEQAQSQVMRDKCWEWYRTTFRTRIWEHGSIVFITTRWHKEDLAGRLLREQPGEWTVLRLPALAETQEERDINDHSLGLPTDQPDPLGRQPGEALCPGRFSAEALHALRRDVGPIAWPAEYQGVPHEAEGAIFKRNWFKRFTRGPDHYLLAGRSVPDTFCWTFVSVDPAATEKKTGDFTAIGVFAVSPDEQVLLLDMVHARLGLKQIVPRLAQVCRDYEPEWVVVEADGFQVGVVYEADKNADIPQVLALKSEGRGKLVRAHPSIIKAERGEIWLPEGAVWVDEFVEELVSFTGNKDPHDDQVDCLSQAVRALDRFGPPGAEPMILTSGWHTRVG